MKSRAKKLRLSRWFKKQFIQKETFKAPVFENLEERQLMSGTMYVGTNLTEISYGALSPTGQSIAAAATPFNDLMKHSEPWARQSWAGDKYVSFVSILDGAGSYTFSSSGSVSFTVISQTTGSTINGGAQATINLNNSSQTVNIQGGDKFLARLTIESGDPNSFSLRLVKNGLSGTFNPNYTDDLATSATLRFMAWQQANQNKVSSWNDRPLTSDTQGRQAASYKGGATVENSKNVGVSIENMIDLANQANKNAWFTIPARADDNYISSMATAIKNGLNSHLKVFVEYSNETWNTEFSATDYVNSQGHAKGWGDSSKPAANDIIGGIRFVAHQSSKIWGLFEDAFGNQFNNRVVKVLGSQSAISWLSDQRLKAFNESFEGGYDVSNKPDALAIAPYFGGPVANHQANWSGTYHNQFAGLKPEFANLSAAGRITRIIDAASHTLTNNTTSVVNSENGYTNLSTTKQVQEQKVIADNHNVHLIAYEGGQHLAARVGGAQDNQALTDALVGANRDNRMGAIYNQYLNMLQTEGVSLYTNFENVGRPNKYGMWGAMEDQNHPSTPKNNTIKSWVNSNPVSNLAPNARAGQDITQSSGNVQLDGSNSHDLDGSIHEYQWYDNDQWFSSSKSLSRNFTGGTHNVELKVKDNGGVWNSDFMVVTIGNDDPGTGGVDIVSDFSGNNAGGWSLGAGASNVVNSGGLRFSGHHSGNVPGQSNNQLLSSKTRVRNESIYVGRTVAAGNDLRGAELKFTIQRHDWNSPRRFFVTANGQEVYNSASYTSSGQHEFTATLGQQSVLSGSGSIDLRIYAYEGFWYGHSTIKAFSLQGGTTGTNHAPVARANNVSRTGAGNVTLNGSASSDPDGDNITYRWTDSSGTQIGTSANLTKYINVGSHQFTLTVRDSGGLTGSKTITATATSSGTGGVNIVSDFSGNNAGGWSLGSGASNVVNNGGLRFNGHHSGNVPGQSNNQLLSSKTRVRNESIYVGRTIAAGNDLRGADLEFTIQRYDWNSPRRFFVTANGTEVYNSSSYTGSGQQSFTATLGQQSVLSGSSSIDLRIYAYEGLWYGHSTVTAFSLQGGTTGGTTPVNVTSNFSGSNAGDWTAGAGFSTPAITDGLGFTASNYSTQQVGSTFAHARANNHYIKRTISSSGTMDLRGAQLQLTMQRPNWNSPHSFVVEIHGAGIGSNGIRLTTATIGHEYGHKSFTLTLPQNSQLLTAGDLEFRVYAYDGLWGGSNSTAIMRAFSLNSV